MKLSNETLTVLKNYAGINPNLVVDEGSTIRTMTEGKNLMSKAEVPETFDVPFAIYDLNEFLSAIGLVDDPQLDFQSDHVVISDGGGRMRTKYFYAERDVLTYPTKDLNMPTTEVSFSLDKNTLAKVNRAAAVLGYEVMTVRPNESAGVVTLSVLDPKDETSNAFSIDVEGEYPEGVDFNFDFDIRVLKMIEEDYIVRLSSKLITQFVNKDASLSYWCAVLKSSNFGG